MITGKRSIADLGKNAAPVADEMREACQLAFSKSIVSMRDDFERMKASPQWRAMEKLEASLKALRADPDINVSEPCRDLLDMVAELLDQAWPHHPIEDIVQPLQKHFDGVKSKKASDIRYQNDPKQAARLEVKNLWEKWQNNPDEWQGKTEFAKDMQLLFPILKSKGGVSITRWCVKWERGED